jgi:acetate kinase
MAMATLTLVSNPGSASRKYALYEGEMCRAKVHVEVVDSAVVCTIIQGAHQAVIPTAITRVGDAAQYILDILQSNRLLASGEVITHIGLRIVAPGSYFLRDHIITDPVEAELRQLESRAPLHVRATLSELTILRTAFPRATVVGVSDSAFHATRPEVARYYGIPLDDANKFDIKRFGYHGLSAASAVTHLTVHNQLAKRIVVCHLGGGTSIIGLRDGKSVDSTMGYSPLEGVLMATRAGSLDIVAAHALKQSLRMSDTELETYLQTKSGLRGISGVSSDIRELVAREATDRRARFALDLYAYNIQKAIGQMAAVLGGIDMLVFTGTVGERSAPMRERIMAQLNYLDFALDTATNATCLNPTEAMHIALLAHSKPVWVIPTDETAQIALRAHAIT